MTIYSGFSHRKRWFSIVMLVYQRVICFLFLDCWFCAFWWPFDQQNWRLTEIILFNILQSKNHCIWIKHNQTLADYRGGSKNVGSEIVGAGSKGPIIYTVQAHPLGLQFRISPRKSYTFFSPRWKGWDGVGIMCIIHGWVYLCGWWHLFWGQFLAGYASFFWALYPKSTGLPSFPFKSLGPISGVHTHPQLMFAESTFFLEKYPLANIRNKCGKRPVVSGSKHESTFMVTFPIIPYLC